MSDSFGGLPEDVLALIRSACLCEFASVSSASLPINTPLGCYFTDAGTINVTTGLAYPVKAERARKNPKVGILLEGFPDEPTVLIAGMAAARDADIPSNVDRYLRAIHAIYPYFTCGNPWEVARDCVYYWTRIIIEVKPKHIWWWSNPAATNAPPKRWDAPPQTVYPASDPAPASPASSPIDWGVQPSWKAQASEVVAEGLPSHLALLGEDQFPLPFRVRSITQTDFGFALELPAGVPWRIEGKASLCFMARATFVGTVTQTPSGAALHVERALPFNPFVRNLPDLWSPPADLRRQLMARLEAELARRGQPIPTMPKTLPPPMATTLLQAQRMERIREMMADQGSTAPYIPRVEG